MFVLIYHDISQLISHISHRLVGGAITILKNMKVNGVGMTSHILWKLKNV
jgi:hypothetical protein